MPFPVLLLLARLRGVAGTVLLVLAALLLLASGALHAYLWDIAYRNVSVLGPLFLVQTCSAVVLAVALAATGRGLVVVASLGLMIGTIVGFVLVATVGLFGFRLTFVSGWAQLSLVAESAAVVVLVAAAAVSWRRVGGADPAGDGEPARVARSRPVGHHVAP